jgi:pimeloyl-ACP methyl ester carboxylesterase
MESQRDIIEARGRRIEIDVRGPEGGDSLILHTGTPSAGVLFETHVEAGAQRGIRHVAYSRPGYARSERARGRTVADCALDVAAIADHLGVQRFFTVGWSGGGPHALACAARLPDRVIAAATIAAVAPWKAEGLDFLDGMGDENVHEFVAAESGERERAELLEREASGMVGASGPQIRAAFGDLLSGVDQAALTGTFAEYLAEAITLGLRDGVWGWIDDDMAFMRDWGFDLQAIAPPVTIWQGGQDAWSLTRTDAGSPPTCAARPGCCPSRAT